MLPDTHSGLGNFIMLTWDFQMQGKTNPLGERIVGVAKQ